MPLSACTDNINGSDINADNATETDSSIVPHSEDNDIDKSESTENPDQAVLPDSGKQPGLNISHSDHPSIHIPVSDKPSTGTPTGDTPTGDAPSDTPTENIPSDTPTGDTPSDTPSYMDVPFVVETAAFPGGDFIDRDNQPVQIHPFRMMKTEVTISQFWSCLSRGICKYYHLYGGGDQFFLYTTDVVFEPNEITEEEHLLHWTKPVSNVVYNGARTFCEWIGGRLPTESEWEYAALFDGKTVRDVTYPWGDDSPEHCYHANYMKTDDSGYYICESEHSCGPFSNPNRTYESSYFLQHPSETHGMTPTGLLHMAGNVSEYVSDYIPDVPGDERNMCPMYILKGGSVFSAPEELAIRNRQYLHLCYYVALPEDLSLIRAEGVGFRCVFDD